MLTLGIESSCDETAVAIVRDGREVLSSKISSQIQRHAPFGGVVPEIAAREHLTSIKPLFDQALKDAGVTLKDIDAIAVTQGPGLVGALLVGVSFAKGLASVTGKPLVPVDHVHAHIHGGLLGLDQARAASALPCLALVVSGGHTNLYLVESPLEFKLIAHTADDACGECLDKVGKLLGLPYPGGPWIEKRATEGELNAVPMPRMIERKSQMEFSYSGLKTHMAQVIAREPKPISDGRINDLCAALQHAAFDQLIRKIEITLKHASHARSVIIAGGVSANKAFRDAARQAFRVPCHFPSLAYCSDNAAMIAALGWYRLKKDGASAFLDHSWDVYPRYPFENYKMDLDGSAS
jgi:N6-L-threonylcarbamoyladenine synthase